MGRHVQGPRRHERKRQESEAQVNVLKKLQNPIALVVQGFVVGGLLFWTTQGQASQGPASPAPVTQSIAAN
jgi:hypothetical protein